MALELVKATLNATWTDIAGDASGVEGIYWQNVGSVPAFISFSNTAPAADEGYILLNPGQSFQDDTGSEHVWAKCYTGSTIICGTLDPAGSGGGGGAVTIADGADVAEGAKADAPYADPAGAAAGSAIALLKGLFVATAYIPHATLAANTPLDVSNYDTAEFQVQGLAGGDTITISRTIDNTNYVACSVISQAFAVLATISVDGLYSLAGRGHVRWTKTGSASTPAVSVEAY